MGWRIEVTVTADNPDDMWVEVYSQIADPYTGIPWIQPHEASLRAQALVDQSVLGLLTLMAGVAHA